MRTGKREELGKGIGRRRFIARLGAMGIIAVGAGSPPASLSLPPLVFIHGIKGSVLTDTQHAEHWLTAWQALGLASPDLSLPLQWQGNIQKRDGLVATAPLGNVGWHDVYAPFLRWASTSGRTFRPFAYDWRRDNLENTDAFIRFLENIRRETGAPRIQVASHSMGGLITFVAINRRPDLFQSVLFAGVPFGSSISFLEDLHSGTANGFNRRILSPRVLFTFASPYSLLPPEPKDSGLVETNGDRIVHNWYSAEDWARQRIGIFSGSGSNDVTQDQKTHLRKALEQTRRFRSELVYMESVPYPAMAVLASDAYPTVSTVKRNGPHSEKGWDFVSDPMRPGDNRVDFTRAMPPLGARHTVYKTSRTHEDLLNDTVQVGKILTQLLQTASGSL